MTPTKKRGGSPRFFIIVCFSLVLLLLDTSNFLFIFNERHCLSGVVKLSDPYFFLVYIHSINKSPVMEKILCTDNGFAIQESWFKDYSTGIDTSQGEGFRKEDSWFVLTLHRNVHKLIIAISPIPGHAIKTKNRAYPLVFFSDINSIVTITQNFSLHTSTYP